MASNVKLCVVDDQVLLREGLVAMLSFHPEIDVVAQAGDARAAYEALETQQPDMFLLDVTLPGDDGFHVAKELRKRNPSVRVVFLSMHMSPDFVAMGLAAGANGYVWKNQPVSELVEALQAVAEGWRYLPPGIPPEAVEELLALKQASGKDGGPLGLLSPRERDVFHLVIRGMSNDDVATQLCIGRRTVETHRANMLEKLQVGSAVELVRFAVRNGLLVE